MPTLLLLPLVAHDITIGCVASGLINLNATSVGERIDELRLAGSDGVLCRATAERRNIESFELGVRGLSVGKVFRGKRID